MNTASQEKPQMLVVDDESCIRLLLARVFGRTFQVACAASVDEGMTQLAEGAPSVILMDVNMPGKDGIQGLLEVRVIDPFVPVIIMTGSILAMEGESLLQQGADAFVTKPFDVVELIRIVTQLTAASETKPAVLS